MTRWFRFYSEALDDPKVQRLDGDTFKAWVNLLCLANRNDGFLPPIDDIAFALRIDIIAARSLVDRLTIGGLIATVKGGPNGSRIGPNGWDKRQYKSDTSTERVKRFRERSKPVTETPPDTETEQKDTLAKANAVDVEKLMFEQGIEYLGTAGVKPDRARAVLGRWKRSHGSGAVIEALGAAQRHGAIDPIPFIEGRFIHKAKTYDPDRITV